MMYLWIILIPFAIWAAWYIMNKKSRDSININEESPIDILKKRFANGELTEEEYANRKAALEKGGTD
jgi:putative membrane protein